MDLKFPSTICGWFLWLMFVVVMGVLLDWIESQFYSWFQSKETLGRKQINPIEGNHDTGDSHAAARTADDSAGGEIATGLNSVGPTIPDCRDDSGSDPDWEVGALERRGSSEVD